MSQTQKTTRPLLLDAQQKIGAGQFEAAIGVCQDLLAVHPRDIDALNTLAIAYAQSGAAMKSAETFAELILNAPDVVKFKTNFVSAIMILGVHGAQTEKAGLIKQAVQACLEDDHIAHRAFTHIWYLLLMNEGAFSQNVFDDLDGLEEALSDPFLHWGMKRLIGAGGIEFERRMIDLRRLFLFADDFDGEAYLPFLCALAEQCHFNEYAYFVSYEERAKVEELEETLNAKDFVLDVQSMAKVALLGCYQDIDGCDFARVLVQSNIEHESFAELIKLLVVDPQKVRALKADIPALSSIEDEVSVAVREQYEDNPYPRWRSITAPELNDEQRAKGQGKRILIAGCGTGQEILNMALHYPEAEMITGIDLSRASLAYGKQKAQALGIENVGFIQADILEADKLDRQFDLISCSGVLHHMKDPVQGWKTLLQLLKPDGVMKVALYSQIARSFVTQCQEWIKEQGFEATHEEILCFRKAIIDMDDGEPLKKITGPLDFYSTSMCRDLLFHVQEHVYDLPQIKALLDDLDLDLLSLDLKQPGALQAYRAQSPDDPGIKNLDTLHAFEQKNPSVFVGMYSFWCAAKDAPLSGAKPDWIFTH